MKWMKLAFLAGLSLSLWGTTTAQAAKRTVLPKYPRQRLFTFKTQRTKVYSYPRAAYARSKVLGVNKSTKKQWTVDKVVTVNGKRYVRLAAVSAQPLHHVTVAPLPAKRNQLVGGYVVLRQLRSHSVIRQLKAIKKTAYWTPTTTHDYWDMPARTIGTTAAVHYGTTYGYRTLYATESLTTTCQKHYLYLTTANGKGIGWLPAHAVIKGTYPNLLQREVNRQLTGITATTTTVDAAAHVKVGVAMAAGVVQRVVLLRQDSTTVTSDFVTGRAVIATTRSATGKVVKTAKVKQTAPIFSFTARADFDIHGYTYRVKVAPTGAVTILGTGGWIA